MNGRNYLHSAVILFTALLWAFAPSLALAELVTFQVTGHMIESFAPDFQVGDRFVANYTFDTIVPPEVITGDNFLDVTYGNVASWWFRFERGYVFDSSDPTTSPFVGDIALGDNKFTAGPDGCDEYAVTLGAIASTGLPLPSGRTLSFLSVQLEDSLPAGNPDLLTGLSIPALPPQLARASFPPKGRIVYNGQIPDQPFFAVDSITVVPEPNTAILAIIGLGLVLIFMGRP